MSKFKRYISHSLWMIFSKKHWKRFIRSSKNPMVAQINYLNSLLKTNKETTFGMKYDFSKILDYDSYKKTVPISVYEDFLPYIDLISNDKTILALTKEIPKLFEPTSGSSSASKLIPYTNSLSNDFQRGIGPWIYDLYKRKKMSKTGTSYWSLTPLTTGKEYTKSNIPIGFEEDSMYFGRVEKKIVDSVMCVPSIVKHIKSTKAFQYVTLLFLLGDKNLNFISVWNPSYLIILLDKMYELWDELLEGIEIGTIPKDYVIPSDILLKLNKNLKQNIKRVNYLKSIDKSKISSIWPNLNLVSCWTEGNAHSYSIKLQELLGDIEIQGKGLIATECFVSFPVVDYKSSVLSINSHFFEFLPMEKEKEDIDYNTSTLLIDELKVGTKYQLVVTTSGGLYRYNIGDIIEVTGYLNSLPLLKFIGRKSLVSDHFGEKLNELHVRSILKKVFSDYQVNPEFYMLALESKENKSNYSLYIESEVYFNEITSEIENLLKENFHYDHCRKLEQLGPLTVFHIKEKGSESFIKRFQENGMKIGDIKPSPLSSLKNWDQYFLSK